MCDRCKRFQGEGAKYDRMIGGSCYYCRAGEHFECTSTTCPCCGEANRKHDEEVERTVLAMQIFLKETGFYAKRNQKPHSR